MTLTWGIALGVVVTEVAASWITRGDQRLDPQAEQDCKAEPWTLLWTHLCLALFWLYVAGQLHWRWSVSRQPHTTYLAPSDLLTQYPRARDQQFTFLWAYVVYFIGRLYALRLLPLSLFATAGQIGPVLTVGLNIWLLQRSFSLLHYFGLFLIVLGIVLTFATQINTEDESNTMLVKGILAVFLSEFAFSRTSIAMEQAQRSLKKQVTVPFTWVPLSYYGGVWGVATIALVLLPSVWQLGGWWNPWTCFTGQTWLMMLTFPLTPVFGMAALTFLNNVIYRILMIINFLCILLVGMAAYGETLTAQEAIGFTLAWCGVILFTLREIKPRWFEDQDTSSASQTYLA